MKVNGKLRLVSQSSVGEIPVELDVQPGRLIIRSGSDVVGDWQTSEFSLRTEGTGLTLEVEGETLLLTVPDRYEVLDSLNAGHESKSVTPLAQRISSTSNSRKPWLAFGGAALLVVCGLGGWFLWTQLFGGNTSPEPEGAGSDTEVAATSTTERSTTTTVPPPTTLDQLTQSQRVRRMESELWVDIRPEVSEILDGFTRANEALNAGDEGAASVECQLTEGTIAHAATIIRLAGDTEFIQLLDVWIEEASYFADTCGSGAWSLNDASFERLSELNDRLVAYVNSHGY